MLSGLSISWRHYVNRLPRFVLALVSAVVCLLPGAFAQENFVPDKMLQDLHWRMIGPFRGGRTRAAVGVPRQPNVFYIGAVNGGVWKSNDFGRTWWSIFDAQSSQSIGDIAVAPSDPNVIYVASGEGLHRPDLSIGNGIYRSSDAGKTWTHLGLQDGEQIPAVAVDPKNPDRVFAAVLGHPYGPNDERGIYRSTDGGKNWQKVLSKDANTGGDDVLIDPSNPQIVYASLWEARLGPWEDSNSYEGTGGGVFKSTDGGNTWNKLTKGLPENLVQAHLAIAPSQPNRLFVVFSTTEKNSYGSGKGMGFYRSDDGGESWAKITDDGRPAMKIGGGDLSMIKVDPKNPDVVYSTSIVTVKSSDGGKTWKSIRGAPGGDDYQNLWINPNDPNIILLVADQGALVTVNGGETWSSWYNQPTAQLYHVATTNEFPYKVCAGQQESGSLCIASRGKYGEVTHWDWHPAGVIEYGYVAPDPLNPNIIYGAGRNEVSRLDVTTGQIQNVTPIPIRGDKYRTERSQPIAFSPIDQHTLFYSSNYLFKSVNGGLTWEAISPDLSRKDPGIPQSLGSMAAKDAKAAKQRGAIYSLALSSKSINTIWAGTDDGMLWITRDGGKNWNDITPKELTGWSKVTQLAASRFDDNTAYASVSRFRVDDLHPFIYRTHDGGKTWQAIVNGLPDSPVNAVREDSVRKGLLFAGTETGVYFSLDDGDHWRSLQMNLPRTSMRDLMVQGNDLVVATHGRSFWILDDISRLRQLDAATESSAHLFRPAVALRVKRSTYPDTPIPPDEPLGENPPSGAIVDYSLPGNVSGPVTLEIVDASGKTVRKFASTDKPEISEEELAKQLIPTYWVKPWKPVASTEGAHRFVWDLHYPSPVSTQHEYPIAAVPHNTPRNPLGPHAVPGQYTVKLTVNGQNLTAPLTVKMDPRVKTPLPALQQKFALESRLASDLSRSSEVVLEAKSLQEQIKKTPLTAGDTVKELNDKLKALLEGPEKPASQPAGPSLKDVNGDIYSLYGAASGNDSMAKDADAVPTPALLAATGKAESDLAPLLKAWEQIKSTDLAAANQKLKAAGSAELRLTTEPNAEDNGVDRE
jgi:photosystem II stability/assembly factor-like uncharacterized protein